MIADLLHHIHHWRTTRRATGPLTVDTRETTVCLDDIRITFFGVVGRGPGDDWTSVSFRDTVRVGWGETARRLFEHRRTAHGMMARMREESVDDSGAGSPPGRGPAIPPEEQERILAEETWFRRPGPEEQP